VLTGLCSQTAQLKAATNEIVHLKVENGIYRASSPLPQIVAPPAQVSPPVMQWCTQELLWRLLAIPSLDVEDLRHVAERKERIPARDRARAEHIAQSTAFGAWAVSPASSKLLVHGDFKPPQDTSALSLFCATLLRSLRDRPRFLSVVWFCGRHADPGAAFSSAAAMLRSLAEQLLRQHSFDTRGLHFAVHLSRVQEGNVAELCTLFCWLVRQLPEHLTLFCLVDGVALYEREDFEGALDALASVLSLVPDRRVGAGVKVLFTSPWGTDVVREAFEEDDLILSLKGVPRLAGPPSESRLERELRCGLVEAEREV